MVRAETARRHAAASELLASDVGQRMRKARQERGMTLAAVGGEDLSRSFLSSVESGRSRISLRALAIVAERLNLPISYFLEGQVEARDAAAEWALNQAEAELEQQRPAECLKLLKDLAVPNNQRIHRLWLQGRAYMRLGQAAEALEALQPGLPMLDDEPDRDRAAEFRHALGAALYATGSYDQALIHLRRALEDATKTGADPALVGRITVTMGHAYYQLGNATQAIGLYRRAVGEFGKVRDYYTQACVYSGLSSAYHQRGDGEAALRYSRLSVGAFRATNSLRQLAMETNNLAVRYQDLGDLDQALASAQEAVARASEIGATDIEALAHSTLAEIYLKRHDLSTAESEAEAVERLAPDEKSRARIDAWKVQADIAAERGDDERAYALYERVLDALRESLEQGRYASTALAYGELLRQRGETARAMDLAFEVARMRLQG